MSPVAAEIPAVLQGLVDAGTITAEQALEAVAAAPGADEFMGFARCMTVGCDERESDRPLRLRRTFMRTMAPDLPLVIGQTTHIEVVDDAELGCPSCGVACAILEGRPPTYQKMIA